MSRSLPASSVHIAHLLPPLEEESAALNPFAATRPTLRASLSLAARMLTSSKWFSYYFALAVLRDKRKLGVLATMHFMILEAVFANGEYGFVSHSLSLSLLTPFHRVRAEELVEQAQQAVALAPIRVVSRWTRTVSDVGWHSR